MANFLRKLRKSHWSINDVKFILITNSVRPMSKDEMYDLKLLLMFPQKFWRNVTGIATQGRAGVKKAVLRIQEIEEERKSIENISSLTERMHKNIFLGI